MGLLPKKHIPWKCLLQKVSHQELSHIEQKKTVDFNSDRDGESLEGQQLHSGSNGKQHQRGSFIDKTK